MGLRLLCFFLQQFLVNYILQMYIILSSFFRFMQAKLKQMFNPLIQKMKTHPKLSTAIIISFALGILIRRQQYRMIYLPDIPGLPRSPSKNPYPYQHPCQHHNLAHQNIEIKTQDNVVLRGWHIFNVAIDDFPGDRLILYYHENAGNIGTRLPFIRYLVQWTNSDVLIVGYRGYSDSEGKPSEAGIKKDGVAILNKAIQISKAKNIPLIVFGRSLGGAVAIHSCSQHKNQSQIKGLILQNTFTSISDVATHLFSNKMTKFIIKFFLLFLLSNHWQSDKLIGQIKSPVFFIKSAKDQLIPIEQMDRLEKLCKAKHYQFVLNNGTHNETWSLELATYFYQFKRFLGFL